VEISWNDICQEGFDYLKAASTPAGTLKIPDFSKPFQLITDASDFDLGGILLHEDHAIVYESRILNSAERNYHTTDKEFLGVVHALKVWRCYLEGSTFTVLTDHNPLTFFPTKPLMSQRQARWSDFLGSFAMKWEFIPGIQNPADYFSRLNVISSKRNDEDKNIHAKRWHKQHIGGAGTLGRKPIECIKINELVKAYPRLPWFKVPENVAPLLKSDRLWWKDDKVVILNDEKLRDEVLVQAHDSIYACHPGRTKTYDLVSRNFW
jgi:hypothetical protein